MNVYFECPCCGSMYESRQFTWVKADDGSEDKPLCPDCMATGEER